MRMGPRQRSERREAGCRLDWKGGGEVERQRSGDSGKGKGEI